MCGIKPCAKCAAKKGIGSSRRKSSSTMTTTQIKKVAIPGALAAAGLYVSVRSNESFDKMEGDTFKEPLNRGIAKIAVGIGIGVMARKSKNAVAFATGVIAGGGLDVIDHMMSDEKSGAAVSGTLSLREGQRYRNTLTNMVQTPAAAGDMTI